MRSLLKYMQVNAFQKIAHNNICEFEMRKSSKSPSRQQGCTTNFHSLRHSWYHHYMAQVHEAFWQVPRNLTKIWPFKSKLPIRHHTWVFIAPWASLRVQYTQTDCISLIIEQKYWNNGKSINTPIRKICSFLNENMSFLAIERRADHFNTFAAKGFSKLFHKFVSAEKILFKQLVFESRYSKLPLPAVPDLSKSCLWHSFEAF